MRVTDIIRSRDIQQKSPMRHRRSLPILSYLKIKRQTTE